ncbi:hypothetical protein [Halorubrum sp. DTA98]|uniref:hypothetical protein n=1 Tax=Halorubrum sp. DTA98 TaxID=3402163 RepID=UPI003AAEBFD8
MSKFNQSDEFGISRRRLLCGSGGALGLLGLGSTSVTAHGSDRDDGDDGGGGRCPKPTLEPGMVHYDDSMHAVCSDDHPATQALQADVRAAVEEQFPTVGALIDAGFVPYFDFFAEGNWSHWINPEFIRDDSVLDPERPESVLVDHTWWRPIGVMFVATDDGEPVDPPPSSYVDDGDGGACTPWHAHVGFPGRYSWWKYRKAYHGRAEFPCRTPWMMHVWLYPHRESIFAHAAPEDRGGPPAEPAEFDTDADPNEVELGPEHLPDAVLGKLRGR